jgi:hypothetical protein
MKMMKNRLPILLSMLSVLFVILSLSLCSCSKPFPYQGSLNGNWSGNLTVLNRNVPIGGTISLTIDGKGIGTGTVALSNGGSSTAKINGQVDSNGNFTGTVSFTLSGTTFNSNWQGKVTTSGNSLDVQGTWTSDHGSGTFSGMGTSSK